MRQLYNVSSFKEAEEFLAKGKDKSKRPLGFATYLIKRKDGSIAVRLWDTDVVVYKPNGDIVLNSGGWRTPTTKDRLNGYSPITIAQTNKVWYVCRKGKWEEKNVPFRDGMIVHPDGSFEGVGNVQDEEYVKRMNKAITKYVDGYIKALFDGKVPAPSAGDCWFCALRTEDGKTMGDVGDKKDHLVGHFHDKYYVPSLLYNAMTEGGVSMFAKAVVGSIWKGEYESDSMDGLAARQIRSALKKYLEKRLAIAY